MKFPIKDFFSKCDQICKNLWIWSHLLKKPLMENFIFVQWSVLIQKKEESGISCTSVEPTFGFQGR